MEAKKGIEADQNNNLCTSAFKTASSENTAIL